MKENIKTKYIHHRNLLNRGVAEFGSIYGAIMTTGVLAMWLNIPLRYAPFLFFGLLGAQYLWGWLFFRYKLLHLDYKWHSNADPNILAIIKSIYMTYQRIAELEQKLVLFTKNEQAQKMNKKRKWFSRRGDYNTKQA